MTNASALQDINVRQDDEEHQQLLYGADGAHALAQRYESARLANAAVGLLTAFAAVVAPPARAATAIVGVLCVLAEFVLSELSGREAVKAARIQEQFDTSLFRMPPNPVHDDPLPLVDVVRLARRSPRRWPKTRWYVNVAGLPLPLAVAVCQRENLLWDADLRRAWSRRLSALAAGWSVLGVVVAASLDWSVRELVLRWAVPSLGAVVFATRQAVAHDRLARKKDKLRQRIDAELAQATVSSANGPDRERLHAATRQWQDVIFDTRTRAERVPGRLYGARRAADEADHAKDAEALRARLLAGPG